MAYNEQLADRIREALVDVPRVKEKKMFSGLAFLVNGKMCINVSHDELMCRIDPELYEEVMEKDGCRSMIMRGKRLKGYVKVSEEGFKSKRNFDYWISICLEFNKKAKASKKRK